MRCRRSKRAWEGKHPVITLHAARHVCASLWVPAGVDFKAISSYMGHANISVTMDLYAHLQPGPGQTDTDKLAALLSGWILYSFPVPVPNRVPGSPEKVPICRREAESMVSLETRFRG
jgi:Phage integrase family